MKNSLRQFFRKLRRIALRLGVVNIGSAQLTCGHDDFIRSLWPVKTHLPLVRIGGDGDGGYLVPNDLEDIHACFSPGVADRVNFELELASRGIQSYLIDGSIEKCPVSHSLIDFEPMYLDGYSSKDRYSLTDWMAKKVDTRVQDLMLQMDIEGYEWASLMATSENELRRFRIIVLEVHNLENIFHPFGYRIINASIGRILKHFHLVHAHPNNVVGVNQYRKRRIVSVMELTFLRKDRADANGPVELLPHPLDVDCVDWKPELTLHNALNPRPEFI